MSGIHLTSINKVMLLGKVATKPEYSVTSSGRPVCRLVLETQESYIVRGETRSQKLQHSLVISNQFSVPGFQKHKLRIGDYITVLGKISVENGRQVITVTDYGHEASFMFTPDDAGEEAPKQAAKGGVQKTEPSRAAKQDTPDGRDDGAPSRESADPFAEGAAFRRAAPSSAPEGFEDDSIPF